MTNSILFEARPFFLEKSPETGDEYSLDTLMIERVAGIYADAQQAIRELPPSAFPLKVFQMVKGPLEAIYTEYEETEDGFQFAQNLFDFLAAHYPLLEKDGTLHEITSFGVDLDEFETVIVELFCQAANDLAKQVQILANRQEYSNQSLAMLNFADQLLTLESDWAVLFVRVIFAFKAETNRAMIAFTKALEEPDLSEKIALLTKFSLRLRSIYKWAKDHRKEPDVSIDDKYEIALKYEGNLLITLGAIFDQLSTTATEPVAILDYLNDASDTFIDAIRILNLLKNAAMKRGGEAAANEYQDRVLAANSNLSFAQTQIHLNAIEQGDLNLVALRDSFRDHISPSYSYFLNSLILEPNETFEVEVNIRATRIIELMIRAREHKKEDSYASYLEVETLLLEILLEFLNDKKLSKLFGSTNPATTEMLIELLRAFYYQAETTLQTTKKPGIDDKVALQKAGEKFKQAGWI